jgi:hypothetical protein
VELGRRKRRRQRKRRRKYKLDNHEKRSIRELFLRNPSNLRLRLKYTF